MRTLVHSVIHNATVTHVDTNWPAWLRLDPFLLHAAGLLPFEQVEVVNVLTGERFATWVEAAGEGSGEVRVHAGSRQPVRRGDVVSIVSYGLLHEGQTLAHVPRVVTVDGENRVVAVSEAR